MRNPEEAPEGESNQWEPSGRATERVRPFEGPAGNGNDGEKPDGGDEPANGYPLSWSWPGTDMEGPVVKLSPSLHGRVLSLMS